MFDQFYDPYPRHEGKKDAIKAWSQITKEQQQKAIEALPKHIERWLILETEKQYIPLPATWLRAWRFDDEFDLPVIKQAKVIEQAWWASESGMTAKGLELGVCPQPGESWFNFKNRLINLIKKTA